MELFPITLPKQNICTETELYYRCAKAVYDETAGTITIPKKSVLTLDTYFNCFSYSKYQQYTHASVLEIHARVQGEVQLRLMKAELNGKKIRRTALLTRHVQNEQLDEVTMLYDFSRETGNGFLYLEVAALSKTAVFAGGHYASPVPAEQINRTKLAAVICTYKREDYVKRNLEHLNRTIFDPTNDIAGHLEVFVIDNGQTLQNEQVENKYITLYPNKNYGGSGGFTRGIIEALKRKSEFSHVLLMDDDILLESSVLVKTIRFLQIVREEHQDLAIGGSMLRLDTMNIQHEAGGRWTGLTVESILQNLEISSTEHILKIECNTDKADFCGWWYCCIPLCIISEENLPLPLFIKIDDIEYGMRNTRKLIFINGIGVWHEPFQKKEKTYLHYYNVRNKLVVNAMHVESWNLFKSMFLLAYYLGKILLSSEYRMIVFPLQGFKDYLKGADYLLQLDSEKQHQHLMKTYKDIQETKTGRIRCFISAGIQFLMLFVKGLFRYKKTAKEFKARKKDFITMDFWTQKLGID